MRTLQIVGLIFATLGVLFAAVGVGIGVVSRSGLGREPPPVSRA